MTSLSGDAIIDLCLRWITKLLRLWKRAVILRQRLPKELSIETMSRLVCSEALIGKNWLSNIIILKSQQLFLAPYPLWEIGVCYIDRPDYVHSNATIPASFSCSGDFYSCFNIFVMFSDVRVLLRAQINQESGRLTNYYNIVTSSRLIDVHKFVNLNHQWWMFRQK